MVLDSYCTWRVPLWYSAPCWAHRDCRFWCRHCGGHNRTFGCSLACWRTSHWCNCSCDAELSWMTLRSQPDVKTFLTELHKRTCCLWFGWLWCWLPFRGRRWFGLLCFGFFYLLPLLLCFADVLHSEFLILAFSWLTEIFVTFWFWKGFTTF